MSIPVWPGKKPRLTPIFGGFNGIGQASFGIFRFVTVTVGAPVAVMMPGAWSIGAIVEISGGVGEPVAAFAGGAIGTGSVLLAAVSGAGANAGSPVGGLMAAGISSR